MKELKTAAIACFVLIVLSIAGFAVYTVRAYLPAVGVILLVMICVGAVLALVYAVEHVHRRFTRFDHIQISQYGSILHRKNQVLEYAPYHQLGAAPARARYQEPEPDIVDADVEEMPALLPRIPTFAEMLESGMVQNALAQGKMIIGFYEENHQARLGSWLDLYSAGNGGVSGSGKSTTTRFLLFQAALAYARFIMIDPHIGDPDESLAYQFSLLPASVHQLRPCNGDAPNVLKRVRWLAKELLMRKKAGKKTPFLVFIIDEFNSVIRHLSEEERKELTKLLLDIEQEGRKFGIFALLIGQRWSAQDLGGADIRTSLASKMAHRFSDEDQAKRFIGSKHGKRLLELETGHWLFYDTKGQTSEMITPETVASDGATIAELMGMGVPTSAPTSTHQFPTSIATSTPPLRLLPGIENDAEDVAADVPMAVAADVNTEPLAPEAYRVLELLRARRGQNEIIEEIWGVKSSGGRPYRDAVEQYRTILAALVGRIGA